MSIGPALIFESARPGLDSCNHPSRTTYNRSLTLFPLWRSAGYIPAYQSRRNWTLAVPLAAAVRVPDSRRQQSILPRHLGRFPIFRPWTQSHTRFLCCFPATRAA